jgi:REP element-mobilizing transposase RayT
MESAALPNRQSIRMKGWDYTASGCYFVTINTHKSRALFGVIVNGSMVLNEAGRVAEKCWRGIPAHFPTVSLDEFVIMPNHLHGVLQLRHANAGERAVSLGDVVGAFKAAVSRIIGRGRQLPTRAKEPIAAGASAIWHRNYWDVIVQDEKALEAIRNYIRFNPQNYEAVMNAGEPQFAGNRVLLELPKTGFLASRGAKGFGVPNPSNPGEAIMSGFLSPMERAVFKAGLEHQRPMIWVKPSGLMHQALPHDALAAIDAGRLLIISPFAESIEAPSIRRAAWCNQYVLAHCDRMVVGYLNPGGMLACILSESDPELEIVYL